MCFGSRREKTQNGKKLLCQHKMFNNKPSGKLVVGMRCWRKFLIFYLYGVHTAWSPVITALVIK